jgi:hypothetical protein
MLFKNATKNVLGEVHVKNLLPKKLRKTFPLSFPPFDLFYRVFLADSLHEELKTTTGICSKIRPENLKKTSLQTADRSDTVFLFFSYRCR